MHGFTAVFDLDQPDQDSIQAATREAFEAAEKVGEMVLSSLEVGRSPANQQWMLFASFDKADK